jgi:3-phytase
MDWIWKLAIGAGLVALLGLGLWSMIGADDDAEYGIFELLGTHEIGTEDWRYGEMVVGGISGLAYAREQGVYYAVSDSRGEQGVPGKVFTLEVEIKRSGIEGVSVRDVLLLDRSSTEPGVQPYGENEIDAEEIAIAPDGTLLVSSERDAENRPWIRRFSADGEWIDAIELPPAFAVRPDHGVRPNLGFEAMTLIEDGTLLVAANEQALVQDGPLASPAQGTPVRLIYIDMERQTPSAIAQYVYVTEPIFAAPDEGEFADNGVTAILDGAAVDTAYDLIVMERAYVAGIGNHVALFGVNLGAATEVGDRDALGPAATYVPVRKTRLLTLSADPRLSNLAVAPDNMEAMVVGPRLRSGEPILLLVSDNNFNPSQRNLFLAFALDDDG